LNIVPETIQQVISEISRLPGYGEKTAQRLAVNLLKMPKGEAVDLVRHLALMLDKVHLCRECGIFTEKEICDVCSDESRDRSVICVVEESFDAFMIEIQANTTDFIMF
jgi:Recombinational DNA repair protein (RecF pathway)